MNIAYMMGTSTATALEAVYGDPKKKRNQEGQQFISGDPMGDTVHISDAALILAAQLGGKAENGQPLIEQKFGAQEQDKKSGLETEAMAGGGNPFASGSSTSAKEKKIQELAQKIITAQSSNMPEETKQAVISGLQAQIDALQQEINAEKNSA